MNNLSGKATVDTTEGTDTIRLTRPVSEQIRRGEGGRLIIALVLAVLFTFAGGSPTVAASGKSGARASAGGSGQTVHVKGYTKKDGTYVPPHDRQAKGSGDKATAPKPTKAERDASTGTPRDAKGRFVRSEEAKHQFEVQSGYPHGRPGYVIDHIRPLACGGADTPSNMQWQTVAEGKAKDAWELRGCR